MEAFLACRLIPLDKNPGLRPIGVGEVLRRIAGKVVIKVVKEDVRNAAGGLQLCNYAAVHTMHDVFQLNASEAVLMVDAENAFNSINRKALYITSDTYVQNFPPSYTTVTMFLHDCSSLVAKKSFLKKVPPKETLQLWHL